MRYHSGDLFFASFLVFIATFLISTMLHSMNTYYKVNEAIETTRSEVQFEAVSKGFGEFTLSKSGKIEFNWKDK